MAARIGRYRRRVRFVEQMGVSVVRDRAVLQESFVGTVDEQAGGE
jgi:hypothetical protein